MYGGSTTSTLLNTPGESASVATAIEGFEMAKRGGGRAALATAAIGSVVAGTIGIVALTLLVDPVASLAVRFRAQDYFALTLLAFASVTALTSRSLIRGFCSLAVGLLIGFAGIDQLTRQSRLTFAVDELGDGVDIVIVAVGLFAVGEALHMAKLRSGAGESEVLPVEGQGRYLSRSDWRRLVVGVGRRRARDVRDRRPRVLHAPLRLPDRAGDPRAADGDPGAARPGRVRPPPPRRPPQPHLRRGGPEPKGARPL
jgi:putative tricarboxylic transport membrane protein